MKGDEGINRKNYKEETDFIFKGRRYRNYTREYTEIEKNVEKNTEK